MNSPSSIIHHDQYRPKNKKGIHHYEWRDGLSFNYLKLDFQLLTWPASLMCRQFSTCACLCLILQMMR